MFDKYLKEEKIHDWAWAASNLQPSDTSIQTQGKLSCTTPCTVSKRNKRKCITHTYYDTHQESNSDHCITVM